MLPQILQQVYLTLQVLREIAGDQYIVDSLIFTLHVLNCYKNAQSYRKVLAPSPLNNLSLVLFHESVNKGINNQVLLRIVSLMVIAYKEDNQWETWKTRWNRTSCIMYLNSLYRPTLKSGVDVQAAICKHQFWIPKGQLKHYLIHLLYITLYHFGTYQLISDEKRFI